jgi:CrcB protein
LVVNVVGSFLLGAVATLLVERAAPTRYLGPLVATGLCGAFTTFSTFAVEVDLRIRSGDIAVALAYVVTSALLGLAAVAGGIGLTLGLLRREGVICASESSARSR